MSFSREKVQFSEEELAAGEALDEVYEAFRDIDGFDERLVTSLLPQIGNIQSVVSFLRANGDDDVANRAFALVVMFMRDNVDLSGLTADEDDDDE